MDWKDWINNIKARPYSALGLLVIFAIPVTIFLVFQSQDTRSSAAEPANLEAEDGNLSNSGVAVVNDELASGGKYVQFSNQSSDVCTQETQACIDGSSVGRDPANSCEFHACPNVEAYVESGGKVIIEAEHNNDRVKGGDYRWDGASPSAPNNAVEGWHGDGYIAARPNDDKKIFSFPNYSGAPEAFYYINFTTPGTYWLFVRSSGIDSKSDSAHFTLEDGTNDGDSEVQTMALYYEGEGGKSSVWQWEKFGNVRHESARGRVTVATPGIHKLRVWMREDGTRIDRIRLDQTKSWVANPNTSAKGGTESQRTSLPGIAH